jgi:predicted nucleotidyltransferase component of viral defense system
MPLTRPLILRHAANRKDAYDAALLDVAQDHALYMIQVAGIFDRPNVVFKGGTSLRKCRLGNNGRFSTDLDLAVPDETDIVDICAALDGQKISGFTFKVSDGGAKDLRIWKLDVFHPDLGDVVGLARLEFARRKPARDPERVVPLRLPIHDEYDFELGALPVIAEVEACAEKLARYRRTPALARDLYDLAWFATRPLDEKVLRRLWVLKVFSDVVEDSRGGKPLVPEDVLKKREVRDFPAASIGVLTQPEDIPGWEAKVRGRFSFLQDLDEDEERFAEMNARDLHEVRGLLEAGGFRR